MDKNKLILPITILLASIILGGFYYASQLSKQQSIEKQQQIEIEQEKQEQIARDFEEQKEEDQAEAQAQLNSQLLKNCLNEADNSLESSFIALCKDDIRVSGGNNETCLNGTLDIKISFMTASNLYNPLFKRILEKREKDKANCFKEYPQK